jgi:hypothetical protein
MAHCPFYPTKVSKKLIGVNPLAYSICGQYSSSMAEELESIHEKLKRHFANNSTMI